MRGWLFVSSDAIAEEDERKRWIARASEVTPSRPRL
jgi:hypothetical protein